VDAPWHLRSVSIHCVTQCTDYCSHLVYTTWYIALMIAPTKAHKQHAFTAAQPRLPSPRRELQR
jgi:hypothetical protein